MTRQPAVLCLPFAGAGSSAFASWRPVFGDGSDLIILELPGHDRRFEEPLCQDVEGAVRSVMPQALQAGRDRGSISIFGHSMGAVLAFELARLLIDEAHVTVARLVVSGSPGPFHPRATQASGLTDDDFLGQIRRFAGYDHPALKDPELRQLLLPILRADVAMHERYQAASEAPIAVPITCIRGAADLLVSRREALTWAPATSLDFQYVEHSGGHMWLMEAGPEFAATLKGICVDGSLEC